LLLHQPKLVVITTRIGLIVIITGHTATSVLCYVQRFHMQHRMVWFGLGFPATITTDMSGFLASGFFGFASDNFLT
jgi:hypothetical protein